MGGVTATGVTTGVSVLGGVTATGVTTGALGGVTATGVIAGIATVTGVIAGAFTSGCPDNFPLLADMFPSNVPLNTASYIVLKLLTAFSTGLTVPTFLSTSRGAIVGSLVMPPRPAIFDTSSVLNTLSPACN